MEVTYSNGSFLVSMNARPAKCNRCGGDIFFYKTKKGKWCILEPLGCGGDGEQVLTFHKCNG